MNPKIITKAMEIIQSQLTDETKLDKLILCQTCLATAKIMMEDVGHGKLASTLMTFSMLINSDIKEAENEQ